MSTFAICLDPNSPNFNTSTLSSNGFSVYSNVDNFTTPIAQNIPLTNLLPPPNGNCPTIINTPPGATQIIVIDQCTDAIDTATIFNPIDVAAGTLATDCCYSIIDLPEIPIPWCTQCEIEFDVYNTSSIGLLVAGNIISSCGPVTDYVIGWYLNGDYSAPAKITGLNTTANFTFQHQHPLTGNQSVPVLAGNYEGIIHDIIINGITYSSVSGSANGIPIPFESCFETVVIDPLDCNNGTAPGKYSHQFDFNSQAVGATSAAVGLTYTLSTSTQFFAYAFKGFGVWDELEIKWISGDPLVTSNPNLYSQPIYLEKIRIGTDTTPTVAEAPATAVSLAYAVTPNTTIPNLNNVWPKSTYATDTGGYFQRVLTLTNLETSSNPLSPDLLEITITPNPTNNNTQWEAGFQCLDTFDCTNCIFDNYPDSLNNKFTAFLLAKTYGCDSQLLITQVSGCRPNNFAPDSSDLVGFPISSYGINNPSINLVNSQIQPPSFAQGISLGGQVNCSYNNWSAQPNWTSVYGYPNPICSTPTNTSITFNKTPNQIQLTFNSLNDYLFYKNYLISTILYDNPNFSSPKLCSNTNTPDYYQVYSIMLPYQAPNSDCGDNTTTLHYFFHVNDYLNTTYVENPQTNFWSITIPQTPIPNCYNLTSCDSCYSVVEMFVTGYNTHANDSTVFSYISNRGSKYLNPFKRHSVTRFTSGGISGSYCFNPGQQTDIRMPWYSVNTIPFISSSNGWVNLPSLGQQLPCDLTPFSTRTQDKMYAYYGVWQVRFPNMTSSFDYSLSTNDFEIYALSGPACPVTGSFIPYWNACPTGSLIYSYIGGVATVYTSSYFWQGNAPLLVIAP